MFKAVSNCNRRDGSGPIDSVSGHVRVRRARHALVGAAVVVLMSAAPAVGKTVVGGAILGDMNWTVHDSPYIVESSIMIGAGAMLSIEPGVEVQLGRRTGILVGSSRYGMGTLVVRGTADAPVRFRGQGDDAGFPAVGEWGSIHFANDATDAVYAADGRYVAGSILEHVVIEGAGVNASGAVVIDRCSPFLQGVCVLDSVSHGIHASMREAPPLTVRNSCFVRCVTDESGGGASIEGGAGHQIEGCSFIGSSAFNDGGGLCLLAPDCRVAACRFERNHASSGAGAFVRSERGVLESCTFDRNVASWRAGGAFVQLDSGSVERNAFVSNLGGSMAGGVYFGETCSVDVGQNLIAGNQAERAGGLYTNVPCHAVRIHGNRIVGNRASACGGGLLLDGESHVVALNVIHLSSAGGDAGGGLILNGSRCTVVGNGSLCESAASVGTQIGDLRADCIDFGSQIAGDGQIRRSRVEGCGREP